LIFSGNFTKNLIFSGTFFQENLKKNSIFSGKFLKNVDFFRQFKKMDFQGKN